MVEGGKVVVLLKRVEALHPSDITAKDLLENRLLHCIVLSSSLVGKEYEGEFFGGIGGISGGGNL